MLLAILELLLFFFIIYLVLTQVVIPGFSGKPMFPLFSRRFAKLANRLYKTESMIEESKIESEIETKRKSLNKVNKEK